MNKAQELLALFPERHSKSAEGARRIAEAQMEGLSKDQKEKQRRDFNREIVRLLGTRKAPK